MRGNNAMKGYFDQRDATAEAFRGGWFHSGDLAVWHPDGYIELRDRKKDIIISGGENISTIEVEQRSEEHTSELQSHSDLVCRLLLEKKKKKKQHRQMNIAQQI